MPIIGVIDSSKSGNLYQASYDSIQTTTVGAGGAASITFSNIPQTYAHLQIRGIARVTGSVTSTSFDGRFNNDSASNYYAYHLMYADGSTRGTAFGGASTNFLVSDATGANATANHFGVFVWDIVDYSNTNKFKTNRVLYGWDTETPAVIAFASSLWRSTSAITSISLTSPNGNFAQFTQIALYGIKGA